ncbi:hypothetical protein A6E05_13990 [Aliivibrio sp. 1S165]|uniref:hypothetical protein n=1 Tax=unclassified Aliivibrio TaxID=2645654 RepID=UPI00080E75CB|nr:MULTISPECIES: hypothetical protein [unclassified Aliivibrio]OCH17394.1 hypothetical protein A6E05_13990 [Aliivibrio sp. 1S165]OCH34388.1 hypothetical protein A6E06_00730 [Aliivibrio sp. 1S175]
MFPQSTVLDPLFWMALGALQVWVFAGANQWAKHFNLGMTGGKWALVGGWWASIILTIAGAFTLLGENEGLAGWYFLGFAGTGLIIAGAVLLRILVALKPKM